MIDKNHRHTPAYPQDLQGRCSTNPDYAGLTLREHFAGLAMQGLCADPDMMAVSDVAKLAVRMADALLDELEKKV